MHNGCHHPGSHHPRAHNHSAMIDDFKIRFLISSILTLPVLALSSMAQEILFSPALGAVLMSFSTISVAINAKLLKINRPLK